MRLRPWWASRREFRGEGKKEMDEIEEDMWIERRGVLDVDLQQTSLLMGTWTGMYHLG